MRNHARRPAQAGIAAACTAALLTGCTPYNNEVLTVPAQTLGPVACAPTGTSPKPSTIEAATAGPYRVESVVDGDTIRIECNGESTRVRLVGINTPETVKEDAPVECGGPEASASLHAILDAGEVFLSTDPAQGERDRYGRLLAYVWAMDGSLVNRTMIELGHAEATGYGKDYAYKEPFEAAAQTARAAGTARWACPR
ncbi:thermonuclease family protein [Pseudarthrobacter sp. SSS035]|uniref:thermonuclease family protein n=1 Tax=Pseudarthrobacter sp. SSS035 TaxID=2931399 RepID=UPI00200C40B8|nr:thermonuclease family protein [Pseudarthrobacter sp. SSS035]